MRKNIVFCILSFLALCIFCFLFYDCDACDEEDYRIDGESYESYHSQYTEEEHLAKIYFLVREEFVDEFENGEYIDLKVEILYDFYDHPRFFMIEIFYNDTYQEPYNQKYIIGTIREDEYKSLNHVVQYFGWRFGVNPYEYAGYGAERKYYAPCLFAVKTEQGITQFYRYGRTRKPVGEDIDDEWFGSLTIDKPSYAQVIRSATSWSNMPIWYENMFKKSDLSN